MKTIALLLLASLALEPVCLARGGGHGGSRSYGGHSSSTRSYGGSVNVRGYTTKSGRYVAPHKRSAPDRTKQNNWSTKGNVNPYTGKEGAKDVQD